MRGEYNGRIGLMGFLLPAIVLCLGDFMDTNAVLFNVLMVFALLFSIACLVMESMKLKKYGLRSYEVKFSEVFVLFATAHLVASLVLEFFFKRGFNGIFGVGRLAYYCLNPLIFIWERTFDFWRPAGTYLVYLWQYALTAVFNAAIFSLAITGILKTDKKTRKLFMILTALAAVILLIICFNLPLYTGGLHAAPDWAGENFYPDAHLAK
jgi:hypothetical protein